MYQMLICLVFSFFQVVVVFTYRELLSGDACVHHSFVHALESLKIWRCNEHHIWHELRCFQHLQSLERGDQKVTF